VRQRKVENDRKEEWGMGEGEKKKGNAKLLHKGQVKVDSQEKGKWKRGKDMRRGKSKKIVTRIRGSTPLVFLEVRTQDRPKGENGV